MSTDLRQLSEREREILKLVAAGLSNQQIANHLGVSVNTVKVHLRNVFAKIGAASRTGATIYAVREGIVTLDKKGQELPAHATSVVLPNDVAVQVPAHPPGEPDQIPGPAAITDSLDDVNVKTQEYSDDAAQTESLSTNDTYRKPQSRLILPIVVSVAMLGVIATSIWLRGTSTGTASPPASADARTSSVAHSRWSTLPEITTPRAGFAAANVGDRIYIIGGENQEGVLKSTERYDVRLGIWATLSEKPTAVADVRAVVLGGKLYVPGGRRSTAASDITSVFERYDPQSESWDKLPDLPQPRSAYALAVVEGKIYLIGGWDGATYRREVFEYDAARAAWHEKTPTPTPRAFMDGAVVEGSVYVVGGENEEGRLASNETYMPAQEGAQPWERRAPMPQSRSRFGATVALSIIHVVGGEPLKSAPVKYNVHADSWEMFDASPSTVGNQPGIVLLDTAIMIIGGKGPSNTYSTEMQKYQAFFTVSLPSP